MPSLPGRSGRPTSAEHQAAVARRLELLRAELSGQPPPRAVIEEIQEESGEEMGEEIDGGEPGARVWQPTADGEPPWWSSATRVPAPRLRVVEPPRPAVSDPSERATDPPPWVPVPGRHASRRTRELTGWVPETLRGRIALGPAQLSVVAVLVAIGLAITTWGVVRARPEAAPPAIAGTAGGVATGPLVELPGATDQTVQPPQSAVSSPGSASLSSAAPIAAESAGSAGVTVDVAGKVRRPGIAVLGPGARVVDALEAAGGVRAGVDLTTLNLARPLVDGEQILVGVPLPPGATASVLASPPGARPASGASGPLVNLNSGTESDLDTLPDVGPVTAQSIISWREEHGGFTSVDELLEVDGIGEATLTRLAPLVTV